MKCQCFSKKMLNSLSLSLSLSHKSVDFHTSHKGFTLIEFLIFTLFRKSPDGQVGINSHKKGFTLIELLIVIGILAVLATVTLLVLNPAQMVKQSRDANRVTEINQINQALLLYQALGGSTGMGTTGKIYVSIPCDSPDYSSLPTPLNGYTYACSNSSSYRNVDGTGWIPVNFNQVQSQAGTLFFALPIDPVNTVANGYYYTYIPGSWALSATMESTKYIDDKAASDGGQSSARFEMGNHISLNQYLGVDSGSAICGNNTKETGETCDGTDLGGATCASVLGTGYTGTLSCNTGCSSFVTTSCVAPWVCGQLITDSRDGKTYATVLIGSQCWMKQNINIGTRIAGTLNQTNNGIIEKYCYANIDANCDSNNNPNYPDGGIYQWDEAMQYAASCNGTGAPPNDRCASPVQGICPDGWHIPSHYEWTTLEKNVGSNPNAFPYDETKTGWLGTDESTNLRPNGSSGFEANLAGLRDTNGGSLSYRGSYALLWDSLESGANTSNAWRQYLITNPYIHWDAQSKLYGFSVRCLKN